MRGFLTHSSPTPLPKKSWCISVSFPSLKHKSTELPYHSRTQREIGLCSVGSKVHRTRPHLFLQATWVQRSVGQNRAGCCLCQAQRCGEVRCTESPVSSPYRRDLCKMQFLNRHTEIEIVCRLNDILLLFQMLQPGWLIPPGNTSALHLPLRFTSSSLPMSCSKPRLQPAQIKIPPTIPKNY